MEHYFVVTWNPGDGWTISHDENFFPNGPIQDEDGNYYTVEGVDEDVRERDLFLANELSKVIGDLNNGLV